MNCKKRVLNLAMIILVLVLVLCQGAVYASTLQPGQEVYMGVLRLMTKTNETPPMGYSIGNAGEGNAAVIWNIVQYNSQTSNEYRTGNLYCVKAGVGFTNLSAGVTRAPYDVFYDMKAERELIKEQNDILKDLVGKTITEDGVTYNRYDALLAALDMLYSPEEITENERKELIYKIIECAAYEDGYEDYGSYASLMKKAFDASSIGIDDFLDEKNPTKYNLTNYALTKYDIKAVQQAVIWYFTNYGEEDGKYDRTNEITWLGYTTDGNTYDKLVNYTPNGLRPQEDAGSARNYQAAVLYNYMIKQAKINASQYTNSSTAAVVPARVDTTVLTSTPSGDKCIIGPIHITELNSMPYTIDFQVKNNGQAVSGWQLLNENKEAVAEGTTVKSLVNKDFYISVPKEQVKSLTIDININYNNTTMKLWANSKNGQEQPLVEIGKEPKTLPKTLTFNSEEPKPFDLALRKYITKINGEELIEENSRVPVIKEDTLQEGTTATYQHKKQPVAIGNGNTVTYKMTIYNEGEKAGRATKVVDQLPTGLKFDKVVSGNFELDSYDETTNRLQLKRKADNKNNLAAYTPGNLESETIEIECTVTAAPDTANSKVLTNVAWIAAAVEEGAETEGNDRDSQTATTPNVNKDNMEDYTGDTNNKTDLGDSEYHYKGQQDDDDFEKLVILPEAFDLKLIKYITEVNNQAVPDRIEDIDVSKLNTLDANGNMTTTADYTVNKNAVGVKKGDIVTYTFRVYNEGTIDGYAQEITEDVPEGLKFLWSEKEGEELKADETLTEEEKEAIEFNQQYLWGKFVYDEAKENIIQISSDYLSKENETTVGGNLIEAFGKNDGNKTKDDLKYKEIAVKFKVVSENIAGTVIRNEAAITEDADKEGNPVDDRDSDTEEWKKYEDDEDYDNVILQSFDLALRKFIIAVSNDTKIENNEYLKNEDGSYTRAPIVDTSKLNTLDENGKLITTATYTHTKEPVLVKQNDIVVYMLRVYNEGDMDGYASEIKDHLPPYLEFVEDEFNEQYGWQVSEDGRTVTTRYLENEKINKAVKKDSTTEQQPYELSYKEVPIMCKVSENAKTSENITNIADITEYLDENKNPVTDRDSQEDNVKLPSDDQLPGYEDHQQDDDDYEKVIVKTFDLALRKWVTQAIVIENGQQSITQTGHQPYDEPEAVVKVELHRKKLNQVTVKFRYSIRVINEGEIEGYAKEVTDYIPQGLKFVAEDNPGWTDEGNNIISTRLLENTLLKPGEYADVEVVLTWINGENNMGVMDNTAEISEDYNQYGVPDKDSTPDNKKEGEDDIDKAPVMLSVSTGQIRIYFTLGFTILITIASGVVLIKKFVL